MRIQHLQCVKANAGHLVGGFSGSFLVFVTNAEDKEFVFLKGHLSLQQNFASLMRALLEAIAASSLSIPISISVLLFPTASEVLGTLYNTTY